MRQQLSLFLTASFLFLGQGVQASSIDDDNASVTQGAVATAVTAVTSSAPQDLKCYYTVEGKRKRLFGHRGNLRDKRIPSGDPSVASVSTLSSAQISDALSIAALASDQPDTRSLIQKTQQSWNITRLHLQAQIEILEWLAADPMGRHHLLQTCRYYRAFAQPVLGAMHPISNELREDLNKVHLIKSIGEQTGDVARFMKDQRSTFEQCSIQELKEAITSGYYKDTLSSESEHGKAYRKALFPDIRVYDDLIVFNLRPRATFENPDPVKLRLVPLHLRELRQITSLNLMGNALIIPPKLDHLTNLECLYLGCNKLTKSPDVTRLGKLKILDLTKNRLTTAPVVRGLSNLKILNLTNNQITSAPDLTGTQVQQADLTGNPIMSAGTSS